MNFRKMLTTYDSKFTAVQKANTSKATICRATFDKKVVWNALDNIRLLKTDDDRLNSTFRPKRHDLCSTR